MILTYTFFFLFFWDLILTYTVQLKTGVYVYPIKNSWVPTLFNWFKFIFVSLPVISLNNDNFYTIACATCIWSFLNSSMHYLSFYFLFVDDVYKDNNWFNDLVNKLYSIFSSLPGWGRGVLWCATTCKHI